MSAPEIVIGSRGSALAMAQARLVVDALEQARQQCRIVIIETAGDRRAPDTAWGEGAFVAAIERALLDGQIDVAVHSAKDVPTDEHPALEIGAFLARADPRDAIVVRADVRGQSIDDLPAGSRVGTDSPRRTGFILARRPDLVLHPLHGNVDTRLRRLDNGETDALVLACAGLDRLGLGARIAERIAPEIVPPAPGQGAIAVQVRREDSRLRAAIAAIDAPSTRVSVEAERAFLAAAGGGCRAPIGALAELDAGELVVLGGYAHPDGSATVVDRRRGRAADGPALGRELASALAARLGRTAIPTGRTNRKGAVRPRVLVTRAAGQSEELESALRRAGIDPVAVPAIEVELVPPKGALDVAAKRLDDYAWVVITSSNGARAMREAVERTGGAVGSPSWAAIGPVTRVAMEQQGIDVAFEPSRRTGATIAAELKVGVGDRVLLVRGDLADADLAVALRARGAEVDDIVAYRTHEAPSVSRALLRTALRHGPIDAVVFTSGSTVRGLVALGRAETIDVTLIPSICIGPETAKEARASGFRIFAVAASPDSAALATTAARALAISPREST
ncbi:MAG: hydroxymethylbilane synthase [Candidatus Limnocylindrales bacterium]